MVRVCEEFAGVWMRDGVGFGVWGLRGIVFRSCQDILPGFEHGRFGLLWGLVRECAIVPTVSTYMLPRMQRQVD